MNKIRLGIIGFGKQGSYYAGLLKDNKDIFNNAELTCICDIDPSKEELVKAYDPSVHFFLDYKKMLESHLLDAVFIETPHYFHPDIAIEAFNNNIHVLMDKPAGVFTRKVRKVNEEKKKHPDLVFSLMLNQRMDPLYVKAKEIVSSSDFGKLIRINWIVTDWYRSKAYYSQGGWRGTFSGEGGGVLLNQAPHQLDLFTWLVGLPSCVFANIKTVGREISVENDVTAIMEFDSGASGVFITSTHDTPGTNRLEVTGEGGKLVVENRKLTFYKNKIKEPEFNSINKEFWGKPEVEEINFTCEDFYKDDKRPTDLDKVKKFISNPPQHLGIIKNFLDVISDRSKSLIAPGEEGINGLTLSNAIHLSGWKHKEVILPLDEEEFESELTKKAEQETKEGTK